MFAAACQVLWLDKTAEMYQKHKLVALYIEVGLYTVLYNIMPKEGQSPHPLTYNIYTHCPLKPAYLHVVCGPPLYHGQG